MSKTSPAEIESVFSEQGVMLDEKLVGECATICQMYLLSAEDLLFKLLALNFKSTVANSEFAPITMDSLVRIKKQLHQELTKSAPKHKNLSTTARVNFNPAQRGINPRTVSQPSHEIKQERSERPAASLVSVTSNISFVGPRTDVDGKKKRAYRYMYEKISERSEVLDQLIDDFADLIRGHYDISELGDPTLTTDEEVVVVGRITHDGDAAPMAKIAEGAIVIESSRMITGGSRASLVLEPAIKIKGAVRGVGGFGLYPGAIVALKGRNGGGGYFLATEFLSIPPLKASPAALGIPNPKLDPTASQKHATVCVGCGPFTVDTDLAYKPFTTFMNNVKAKKPDVLLLIGPFVDSAHPKIKLGDIDSSPEQLFTVRVRPRIDAFLKDSPGSIVLIVPSVRCLTSTHAVYPQAEPGPTLLDKMDNRGRVHLLPNPCRFTINDISFATTSVDTLFHLRKEEYHKRGVEVDPLPEAPDDLPTDAMANLCRHLLLQRSFYPIFPSPPDLSSDVNLDMSHFDNVAMVDEADLDYAPDVLILPSRLKQFSKVVHSTTTLNPSFLSKGSYGIINIGPRSVGTPKQRVTAEVLKSSLPLLFKRHHRDPPVVLVHVYVFSPVHR